MASRTERLYQRDSSLTRFDATILSVEPAGGAGAEAGGRFALLLDRTAFYPEGGGQPFDTGSLGGLPVVDVQEGAEGPLHFIQTSGPGVLPPPAGTRVEGTIDRQRRFDHMQQHSGQHLLSRAFLEVASARTRSFHLGSALCTIDVEMSPPDEGRIREAARRANSIIWADLPVQVRESEALPGASATEDPALSGLKLKPGDPVRTIVIEGFDETPCGGTHVARTGQVGLVAVTAWEPWKKLSRITFACGSRAATHFEESRAVLAACVAALSAPPADVPGALARLVAEKESLHRRVGALSAKLAGFEAAAAAESAREIGAFRLLERIFDGAERSVEEAQALIRKFVEPPGRIALVAVIEGGKATLLAARSQGEGPALGAILGEVARSGGGRGGGSPEAARAGGIPAGEAALVFEQASARIVEALRGASG